MGLFEQLYKMFARRPEGSGARFRLLNGYEPRWSRWQGGLYESELIRAAIHARATHVSKLSVTIQGSARPTLQTRLRQAPNGFQTWSQFLYRLSTILDVTNSAFITPVLDDYGDTIGIYAPLPEHCEFVEYQGTPFVRYRFGWGEWAAIELSQVGILTKFQYSNDLLGDSNAALAPTMQLIHMINQGIEEGMRSAASYKFMARLKNFQNSPDLARERKRFTENNLSRDSDATGLLLFPNTYDDIKQIEVKPWVADADQMKVIRQNVFDYFGVNEEILTNKAYGDAWAAFYEGAVEPFAIQLSSVLSKQLFSARERAAGAGIMATANRLQFMSTGDKLNVSAEMADRGLMTRNEIREIWQLPPLPEPIGSQLPIRGEYYNVGDRAGENGGEGNAEE